jgi:ATP-dependent DNA helicase RecG
LDDLRTGHGITRRYRNRRIGEFLKELNLTEGRGTGIPKILRAIQKNRSPLPVFETDDDRTYFVARFPIHPKAPHRITKEERSEREKPGTKLAPSWHQVATKLGLTPVEILKVLNLCKDAPKMTDLMEAFSWSDRTKFRNKYLNPLIGEGLLEMTIPDKPQSSLQRYRLTAKGKEWMEGQR